MIIETIIIFIPVVLKLNIGTNAALITTKSKKQTPECDNKTRYNFQMYPGTRNSGRHKHHKGN